MIVTNKVNMDLTRQTWLEPVEAVQNDRYSRNLEISVYSDGIAWTVPEDGAVLIRYSKSDGKGGEYDTLPNGKKAWSAEGNVLTVALAPQVLTTPGPVSITVSIIKEEKQLSTFTFFMNVHPVANAVMAESEPYCHVTRFLPAPVQAEAGQYLRISQVDEHGCVNGLDAVTLTDTSSAIVCEAEGEKVFIKDASDCAVKQLRILGKTRQDVVMGKNLLENIVGTTTQNGITFTVNDDGSITATGHATAQAVLDVGRTGRIFEAGEYIVSGAPYGIPGVSITAFKVSNGVAAAAGTETGDGVIVTCDGTNELFARLVVASGTTANNIFYPMIRHASVIDDTYEPYTGGVVGPSPACPQPLTNACANGNVSVYIAVLEEDTNPQKIGFSIDGGLAGIPVSDNGNYTDEDGQQWVCDEVDFARGIYIRRIGRIENYSDEVVSEPYVSTTGELSEGATVLFILETTQETVLDVEAIEAFQKVRMNRPNTVIYNDGGAWQMVEYLADTKSYIDAKFAALYEAVAGKE